jgi:hypothetical protein
MCLSRLIARGCEFTQLRFRERHMSRLFMPLNLGGRLFVEVLTACRALLERVLRLAGNAMDWDASDALFHAW